MTPAAPEPLDVELVGRASSGDADAFGVLVARYEDRLFNFLLRYCGNPDLAKDMCQEAFFKAFKGLPGFRVGAPFKPWLYQVALNTVRSHMRKGARRELGVDELPDGATGYMHTSGAQPPGADTLVSKGQDAHRVQRALATLPDGDREILVLRFVEDFNNDEIARMLGLGESAMKMRVHRALGRLKDALGKMGEDP